MSTTRLESEILDVLVNDFALNRPSLVEEVRFEWSGSGQPPSPREVGAYVDELLARGWLREDDEVSDDGTAYSVVRLTDEGKAEWRRRNPLEERLNKAWFGQEGFIYAPSPEIAEEAARLLYSEYGFGEVDLAAKTVEPWTYELDDSGDIITGVRVHYPVERRVPALRQAFRDALERVRFAAWRRQRRR